MSEGKFKIDDVHLPKRLLKYTPDELDKLQVPIDLRDECVHYWIPLNKCRLDTYYLPWKCSEERINYERCKFKLHLKAIRRSEKLMKADSKIRKIYEEIEKAKKQQD